MRKEKIKKKNNFKKIKCWKIKIRWRKIKENFRNYFGIFQVKNEFTMNFQRKLKLKWKRKRNKNHKKTRSIGSGLINWRGNDHVVLRHRYTKHLSQARYTLHLNESTLWKAAIKTFPHDPMALRLPRGDGGGNHHLLWRSNKIRPPCTGN